MTVLCVACIRVCTTMCDCVNNCVYMCGECIHRISIITIMQAFTNTRTYTGNYTIKYMDARMHAHACAHTHTHTHTNIHTLAKLSVQLRLARMLVVCMCIAGEWVSPCV